jgi:hypothetical protein
MVNDAIDRVDAVQLVPLALTTGDWIKQIRMDHLRNATWLLLLAMFGRRAGEGCCGFAAAVLQDRTGTWHKSVLRGL